MAIAGLMEEGYNEPYQKLVREAAWTAILVALRDPETKQAFLRNEDIIEALLDLRAVMLSTSKVAASPTKLRKFTEEFARRLRMKTNAVIEARPDGAFDDVVYLDEKQ